MSFPASGLSRANVAQIRSEEQVPKFKWFKGNSSVNNLGGPGKPSCEEIWDGVLSSGRAIFGVATDDAHHYRDFTFARANPGRGWVVARATELTQEAIIEALATGDFYASTRVTLSDLDLSTESISLKIEQEGDFLYRTSFTGRNGVVLAETTDLEATYRPKGDEGYVRAPSVRTGIRRGPHCIY